MQFFAAPVRVPASSPYERDPRVLPRAQIATGSLLFGADAESVAAFWTAFDKVGDYQTLSPASGTTRTVINITGSGCLLGLVGPLSSTNDAITTWTVTRDGVVYVISHGGHTAVNTRSVIGSIVDFDNRYTTAANAGGYNLSTDIATRRSNDNALTASTPHFQVLNPMNIPRFIKFDTSLLITVALSSVLPVDALAAYAGAIWHLDS